MARSRKISTDISIEIKLNRVSDFAAMLYTWMIPHAKDDCRLPKRDPEELRLLIIPGRKNTAEDVQEAIDEMVRELLIGIDAEGFYFFPAEVFYKFQSYIGHKNRRDTPKLSKINGAENSGDCRKTAESAGDVREVPENSASPSLSLSPSLSPSGLLTQPSSGARAKSNSNAEDLGLGERDPAVLVGRELWEKLHEFWRSKGKHLGIVQLELFGAKLLRFKQRGYDPVAIAETTLRCQWFDFYQPDESPPDPAVYDFNAIRSAAAEAAAKARPQ